MPTVSLFISLLSLCISLTTVWLTLFRRGRLAMTKPRILFFGYDPGPVAKVFLRSLLYSTAVRGQVVEALYVSLQHDGSKQMFGFWGYGEADNLVPGSGLYIGQTGLAVNHHFVQAVNQPTYEFLAGRYTVDVFARLVSSERPVLLTKIAVTVTQDQAEELSHRGGVLFDHMPDTGEYVGHVRPKDRP